MSFMCFKYIHERPVTLALKKDSSCHSENSPAGSFLPFVFCYQKMEAVVWRGKRQITLSYTLVKYPIQ